MLDWIPNKLLVPNKSWDHEEADKKLVALPGNTSFNQEVYSWQDHHPKTSALLK